MPKAAPEDVRCWQEDAMNLSEHTFEEDPIDPYYSEPPAQTDLQVDHRAKRARRLDFKSSLARSSATTLFAD